MAQKRSSFRRTLRGSSLASNGPPAQCHCANIFYLHSAQYFSFPCHPGAQPQNCRRAPHFARSLPDDYLTSSSHLQPTLFLPTYGLAKCWHSTTRAQSNRSRRLHYFLRQAVITQSFLPYTAEHTPQTQLPGSKLLSSRWRATIFY